MVVLVLGLIDLGPQRDNPTLNVGGLNIISKDKSVILILDILLFCHFNSKTFFKDAFRP